MAFAMTACYVALPGDVKNLFTQDFTHVFLTPTGEATLVNSADKEERLALGKYGKDSDGLLVPLENEETPFIHQIALNSLVTTLTKKLKTSAMIGYFKAEIIEASSGLDNTRAEVLELLAKSSKNATVRALYAAEASPIELDSEQQQALLDRAQESVTDEETELQYSDDDKFAQQYTRIMNLVLIDKKALKDACTTGNTLEAVSEYFGFEKSTWANLISQVKHFRTEHSEVTTASEVQEQLASA